jgi:type I restriction enzyme S subunit
MNKPELIKLETVADIKLSNVDKKTKNDEMAIKLCNYTDVYKNAFINEDKVKHFMEATCNENEYNKFLLQEGQVAITKDSETPDDIGIPTYIAQNFEDVVLGYHLSLITPQSEKLDGKFLNYWLYTKQIKSYFENNAGGSGQRCSLNLDVIKSIPLFLPNKKIQEKISSLLLNLDKKIELNNKINQELESMAKTLYDYWFVQFDFPDSNGKPYKSSGGKMVYNKELKKEIPEGWEAVELNKNFDIDSGYPFESNSFLDDGKYKVITIKNVQNKQLNTTKVDFINKLPSQISKTSILNIGDILMSLTGDTGRICFTNEENLLLNQRVGHIYSKGINIDKSFIYFLMQSEFIYKQMLQLSTGSNQKNLSPIELLKIKIPYNYNVIVQFIKIIKPIYRKLIINQQENQELSNLRDWLLPMLMNGQVKVK